nr:tRNA (guanosine(46)-N7)-methyltransferase TrmB [Marinimicrobium agarilyticum]
MSEQDAQLSIRPEYKPKAIRSYVIRAGRITEGQRAAFDQWWPEYGLSLHDGLLDLEQTFGRQAPLVLEIGFGMGDSLLTMARQEPEKNFIGIEVHPPGVGRLIKGAGEAELTNLKVYMADAIDVLDDCIPQASVDRFQLYFPDPWHKKKHHKRRIVQPAFVQKVRGKLTADGVFHLATDWQNYAETMREVMEAAPGWENAVAPGAYAERPDYRPITKFEQRGARLGHGVWDLLYRRLAQD